MAEYQGTTGNDVLTGTNENDVFVTNGGDDILLGGGGKDKFYVNKGTARVSGGSGLDIFKLTDFGTEISIIDFSSQDILLVNDGIASEQFIGNDTVITDIYGGTNILEGVSQTDYYNGLSDRVVVS